MRMTVAIIDINNGAIWFCVGGCKVDIINCYTLASVKQTKANISICKILCLCFLKCQIELIIFIF